MDNGARLSVAMPELKRLDEPVGKNDPFLSIRVKIIKVGDTKQIGHSAYSLK